MGTQQLQLPSSKPFNEDHLYLYYETIPEP